MAATLSSNGDMKLQEPSGGHDASNVDSLSKAAEAASNINALLIAQGKLKPSQLSRPGPIVAKKKLQQVKKKFDAEVEINDAPIICRDILTRNSSQEEIAKKSGASISTKGRYISPENRTLADTSRDRPLYLYIQAETEDNVQRAVLEINQVILKNGGIVNQTRGSTISVAAPVVEYGQNVASASIPELMNNTMTLVHGPQPDLSQPPPSHPIGQSAAAAVSIATPQVQFLEEKMFIGLEHAPPSFDVRGMILGSEGSFLQHIHTTSGAVVTLRGRNSGYLDPKTALESTEPMHIHLKHMTEAGLEHAKQLAGDLIKTVQNDYSQFQRQLALQPPAAAFPSSVSMSHHADHSASLVSRQRATEPVMNYQTMDQHVMFSSSGSRLRLAAPPLSLMQQPASQMVNLSRPPTYVQAAPLHPLTTSTLTQAVGYNSLTSQGVEVVHQTIPISRPLASIQPLNPEVTSQPMLAPPSHQLTVENAPPATIVLSEAGSQAVPVSIHLAPSGYAGVQTVSQPSAVVITSQLPPVVGNQPPAVIANHLPPPVKTSHSYPPLSLIEGLQQQPVLASHPPHMSSLADAMSSQQLVMTSHPTMASVPPPVVTSQPPPVMTSVRPPVMTSMPVGTSIPVPVATGQPPPVMTSIPPPVVITSHPPPGALPESHVVIVSQAGGVLDEPMISLSGPQQLNVMHKAAPETVTYIVQQPVERQLVCIDQPDVSVPPPLTVEHVAAETAVVGDHSQVSHQPPVAVNEYGEPLEVVEILQPRTHHMAPLQGAVPLPHSACHITGVAAPPHISNSVPRYASIPSCPSSENSAAIPSLMDLEVQNSVQHLPPPRRQVSSLPPIEPPPHLADGYQSKRPYPGEYDLANEHRPPYRGSRHPYSARSPPPPSHDSTEGGPPRHKRSHHPSIRHPPPPPPPPV